MKHDLIGDIHGHSEAIETVLKGMEIELPDGQSFFDKDGNARHNVRVRWFDGEPGALAPNIARLVHHAGLSSNKSHPF